jgi:MinD-like ATPase involved in chromosome partitioning or flagellar assembly
MPVDHSGRNEGCENTLADSEDDRAGGEPVQPELLDVDPVLATALEPARRLTAAALRFGRLVEDSSQVGLAGGNAASVSGASFVSQLRADRLVRPHRRRPSLPGWRRTLYLVTAGLINMPPSAAELRKIDTVSKVKTPVAAGHHRVAILSMKGGVGKTTIAVGLGSTLASLRGDRIVALDANPDRGTLADKVPVGRQSPRSIRDVIARRESISGYTEMRDLTAQIPSGLEVLGSGHDLAAFSAFGADDYCAASAVLERFYSVCIADCGTDLEDAAMSGVLRMTDQIVLVTTPCVDSARSAAATLDWLAARGKADLARNAVVVVNAVRRSGRAQVDLDALEEHFEPRCRAVTRVPYDPYLAQGADVDLDQVADRTSEAFVGLAAEIAEGFSYPGCGSGR